MPENVPHTSGRDGSGPRRRRRVIAVGILAVILPFLLIRVVLHSPMAAPALSSIATNFLGQDVAVAGISLAGSTLTLHGLTVASPPGFAVRYPISAATVAVTPDLAALVTGTRKLARLDVTGLTLQLERTPAGSWNLWKLAERFRSGSKRPRGEFQIGHLAVRDAKLLLNGRQLLSLALTAQDIATQGTKTGRLELSGMDSADNPIKVAAAGRLGKSPSGHCTITAPALALAPLTPLLGETIPVDLHNATARLSLTATADQATVRIKGVSGVDRLTLKTGSGTLPLMADLQFAGWFSASSHRAELEHARLTINKRFRLETAATLDTGKEDGTFSLTLAPGSINLADIGALLPGALERQVTLSGTLAWPDAHLQGGSRTGITAGTGTVRLRNLGLSIRNIPLLAGGTAEGTLSGDGQGWHLVGQLSSSDTGGKTLLEALELPVSGQLGKRLQLQRLAVPALKARLLGADLSGSLAMNPTAAQPFIVSCTLAETTLTVLNRFLATASPLRLTGGTGRANLQLRGSSLNTVSGTAEVTLNAVAATVRDKPVIVRQATLRSALQRKGSSVSAQGTLEAIDGEYAGKSCSADGQFTVANRRLTLRAVQLRSDQTGIALGTASLDLPAAANRTGKDQPPLTLTFREGTVSHGKLAVNGISGTASGRYARGAAGSSLRGKGTFSAGSIAYNGQTAAALSGTISATGSRAEAAITGTSLGGTIHGIIHGEPLAPDPILSWSAVFLEQRLDHLARLVPNATGPHPSAGIITARTTGRISKTQGLSGTLALNGSGLSLSRNGKTLLSDLAVQAEGTAADGTITLTTGTIAHQQGTKLHLRGSMARFAAKDRSGSVSVTMPSTPINGLVDIFVALLPPKLQEAVGSGTSALTGTLTLANGAATLDGAVDFTDAGLELASQKLTISHLAGQLPFSLQYPWPSGERITPLAGFNRSRFPQLRKLLGQTDKPGSRLSLARMRYGTMEFGPMDFTVRAEQGMMTIDSFSASLYGGSLRGSGQMVLKPGSSYGANLLMDNLSLARFCDAFPAIRGYISGRVDGTISLIDGRNGGGLTGYVHLWTRSGNGERMLVSKEFLQKLAGKKLRGFLLSNDRAYDTGEVVAYLRKGFLTFEKLDISHTTTFGVKDLRVSVVPVQNRIALDHLLESIREAAARGKSNEGAAAPIQTDLQWLE